MELEPNDEEFNQDNELVPAGFWMRFWAYIVDLFIISSISGIIITPLIAFTNIADLKLWIYSVGGILTTIISFSYFVLFTKIRKQTLGKQIFGLKVYSDKGKSLQWKDILMREVIGRYIHQSLVITNALYFIVPFHSKKKGLHDFLGETRVVLEPRNKY